jgi:peptidylprolyl isomerase
MIFNRTAVFLTLALTIAATAQTPATPTTRKKAVTPAARTTPHTGTAAKTTTTARTAAAAKAATVADAKDTPPNVPKIEGTPKPLYALRYVDTVIGTGPLSESHKYYTVHYTGWLTDGTKFDSSVDRGSPITFPYGARQVIPGWDTGFEGMRVGGKRRLYIPYQLAYGESGRPPVIPAKADLIFDIEFVGQSDTPPTPPPAPKPPVDPSKPADDQAKPADAPAKSTETAKPAETPAKPEPKP